MAAAANQNGSKNQQSTHFEGVTIDDIDPVVTGAEPERAVDVDGIPYCRKHHCRMKLTSGAAKSRGKDYRACPVDGCTETGVSIRKIVENAVPKDPQLCARCKTPTVCERDKKLSTALAVVLSCPKCGWHLAPIAVPQLAMHGMQRDKPAGIGDR